MRTIPSQGKIIFPKQDRYLQEVLEKGCWSETESLGFCTDDTAVQNSADWQARLLRPDGSHFDVFLAGQRQGCVHWQHTGEHNVSNALAAIESPQRQ